jgi:hypothetical protein
MHGISHVRNEFPEYSAYQFKCIHVPTQKEFDREVFCASEKKFKEYLEWLNTQQPDTWKYEA